MSQSNEALPFTNGYIKEEQREVDRWFIDEDTNCDMSERQLNVAVPFCNNINPFHEDSLEVTVFIKDELFDKDEEHLEGKPDMLSFESELPSSQYICPNKNEDYEMKHCLKSNIESRDKLDEHLHEELDIKIEDNVVMQTHANIGEKYYRDEEDYCRSKISHCWNTSVLSRENVVKVLSVDKLFESATLSTFDNLMENETRTSPKPSITNVRRSSQIKFTFINDCIKKIIQYNENKFANIPSGNYQFSISSLPVRKPVSFGKRPNRDFSKPLFTKKSRNSINIKRCTSWLENFEKKSSLASSGNLETTADNSSNESSSISSCCERHHSERRNCVIQKTSTDGERCFTEKMSIDGIAKTEEANSLTRRNRTERILQSDSEVHCIPSIFKGLCFLYYTYDGCYRKKCNYKHYVSAQIIFNISSLNESELLVAYDYAKKRYTLFMATFSAFAENFAKLHCSEELLASVNIVMKLGLNDKTPFIKKILSCLCDIGLPLIDAVEKIYQCEDSWLNTRISLADILLDIICVPEKKDSLLVNWRIIQSLIKNRKEPLDNVLVEEVMQICSDLKNVELAQHVINDIIATSLVNLVALKKETLTSFLNLVKDSPGETILMEKIRNIKVSLLLTPSENGQLSSPSENPVSGKNYLSLNVFL